MQKPHSPQLRGSLHGWTSSRQKANRADPEARPFRLRLICGYGYLRLRLTIATPPKVNNASVAGSGTTANCIGSDGVCDRLI